MCAGLYGHPVYWTTMCFRFINQPCALSWASAGGGKTGNQNPSQEIWTKNQKFLGKTEVSSLIAIN